MPTPVITIAAVSDTNEGMSSGLFQLTRATTSGPLTVNVGWSGTASSSDYWAPQTAYFADGSATAMLGVMSVNDTTSEPTETVVATLASGSGYTVGTDSSASINIFDNDAPVVSVEKIADVAEGDITGQFRVSRIGNLSSSLTVNLSVSGTATSGTDYQALSTSVNLPANSASADIFVSTVPDNLVEGSETVLLAVGYGMGYTPANFTPASVIITDDPPVVTVLATDTAEGSAVGGFSFIRSGGKLSEALAFTYSVGGTATSGTDFTALSGSLSFPADIDRVELLLEAIGDNTVDDGETVTATVTGGGTTYTIGSPGGSATVTIADQALTVSVMALNDGEEGGTNPKFRFTRSGDISASLTVGYTVSGTATSGTDFTAMAGTVTFAANDPEEDVTVSLTNDTTAEPTETITATLDPPSGSYMLGNESDTVYVKDNDTNRVVWKGGAVAGPNNWNIAANWTTNAVPTESDDVYFDGYQFNTYYCENVGASLSGPLYGMHIVNGFSPLLILDKALTVQNYEQQSATLNQPSARDLTVTGTMLWTGGTLDATASGAKVNIDGAVARFDGPNTGSMSTSSTLNLVNNAIVNVMPGTLAFMGGDGVKMGGEMNVITHDKNVKVAYEASITTAKINIAADGKFNVKIKNSDFTGAFTTKLPILRTGGVMSDSASCSRP